MTESSDDFDWDFSFSRLTNSILDGLNEIDAMSDAYSYAEAQRHRYEVIRGVVEHLFESGYVWGVTDHMNHPMRATLKGVRMQEKHAERDAAREEE